MKQFSIACAVTAFQASPVLADDLIMLNTPGEVPQVEFNPSSNTFSLFNQSASGDVFTLIPPINSNEQIQQNSLTVSKAAIALMMTGTSSPTVIDYSKLTSAMVEPFSSDDEVIACATDILLDETNSCTEIERAQEVLQLHKSIQALARALELSGSGIPTRVHEDIIKQDIIENGLDAGLITPAARLARIYAVDVGFFAENRGQDIYELSNLALGYIFIPDFPLQNDNGFWSYNNRDHYEAWVDTGEGCDTLKIQIENQISLLEYKHPSLSDAASDYAILDNFGNEVSFFDNNNPFDLYAGGLGYQLRGSTSPYDIRALGMPNLHTLSYVDSRAMVVQRLSPERWGSNTFDPLQSFLENNIPYQYFSGGGQVCINRCVGSPMNQTIIRGSEAIADAAYSTFREAVKSRNIYAIGTTAAIAVGTKGGAIYLERNINNTCVSACTSIQDAQNLLNSLDSQQVTNRASLLKLQQRLHDLERQAEDLEKRFAQVGQNIETADSNFDNAQDAVNVGDANENLSLEEERRLNDEQDAAGQEREDAYRERDQLPDEQKQNKQNISQTQSDIKDLEENISKLEQEQRQAAERLREAEQALDEASGNAPRVLADNCLDPNFSMPAFTTCTLDGTLVPDQMAIDMAVYEAECTNITVPIGYMCTVVNGEAVITSMQINAESNFVPARNHCHYMYVAEGYTCTMVDGQPVIEKSYGSLVDDRSFGVSLSPCNYTKPAEGFVCVDGPTGPTLVNEVDPQQIQRLISRTQSRSCSQNNLVNAPLVDTFNIGQIDWLGSIDFDQGTDFLPLKIPSQQRFIDFNFE